MKVKPGLKYYWDKRCKKDKRYDTVLRLATLEENISYGFDPYSEAWLVKLPDETIAFYSSDIINECVNFYGKISEWEISYES